jgi:hypothetical protein
VDQYVKLISERGWISGLPRLGPPSRKTAAPGVSASPAPLALPHALHRAPAGPRAEPLQRRPPRAHEAHIAARPVAAAVEKTP